MSRKLHRQLGVAGHECVDGNAGSSPAVALKLMSTNYWTINFYKSYMHIGSVNPSFVLYGGDIKTITQ